MSKNMKKIVRKRNRLLGRLDDVLIQTYDALKDEDEFPTRREIMDLVEFVRQERNAVAGMGKYSVTIR